MVGCASERQTGAQRAQHGARQRHPAVNASRLLFFDWTFACAAAPQELEMMIYNFKPYFTLKDSVMDPSYDGPDMT